MNTVEAMFTISVLEAIVVTLIGAILGILFYKLLYEKEPKATTEYLELLDELYEFVNKTKFEKLGVFKYSKEDGTPAAKIKEQVHPKTKQSRLDKIMSLEQKISKIKLVKFFWSLKKNYK